MSYETHKLNMSAN